MDTVRFRIVKTSNPLGVSIKMKLTPHMLYNQYSIVENYQEDVPLMLLNSIEVDAFGFQSCNETNHFRLWNCSELDPFKFHNNNGTDRFRF